MAQVRIVMILTIDGFLPPEENALARWVKTDKKGFAYWRERSTVTLFPHYPLIDLILDKEKKDNPCTYLAEIADSEGLELFRGLSVYRLVDEMVLYRLPVTVKNGNSLSPDTFPPEEWAVAGNKTYRNGICRTIYRRKSV